MELSSIYPIAVDCKEFIQQSNGLPILKVLPSQYGDFKKIKVRHRNTNDAHGVVINNAFNRKIYERAVFCNGAQSIDMLIKDQNHTHELYYVFPKDGFNFLYNTAVHSIDDTSDCKLADELLSDVLAFGYTDQNLVNGIESGAQIILHEIPYYYGIQASQQNYTTITKYLNELIIQGDRK